jgi:hypothetical protein
LRGRTVIEGELIINGVVYDPLAFAHNSGSNLFTIGSGSSVDLAELTVQHALYVLGDVTIEGMAVFRSDVAIEGNLTLSGSLTLSGTLVMSRNQAGFALIPQNGTGVTVLFDPVFDSRYIPVITVSSDSFASHRIRAGSATGFLIEVREPAAAPIIFSWHALVVDGVQMMENVELAIRRIPFPVDAAGIPFSSNTVWNSCIRNQVQLDSEGQPFSCGRYHTDHVWTHPDLTIEFLWRPDLSPALTLPEGFVAVVQTSSTEEESVIPEESKESGETESLTELNAGEIDEADTSASASSESSEASSEASSVVDPTDEEVFSEPTPTIQESDAVEEPTETIPAEESVGSNQDTTDVSASESVSEPSVPTP